MILRIQEELLFSYLKQKEAITELFGDVADKNC